MKVRVDRRYLYKLSRSREDGVVLILVLFIVLLFYLIGMGFGLVLYIEKDINRNYYKSLRSLYVAESGISEALWRLSMLPGTTITVNGITFDPSINIDPQNLLGDGVDNDTDGDVDFPDDPDELNAKWDWYAFILLNSNAPQTTAGTDGDTLILPTIIPSNSWVERNWDMETSEFHVFNNTVLAYTHSPNPIDPVDLRTDPDVLEIRFLLEGDLDLDGDGLPDNADLDGDGTTNEIVFYDETLPSNGLDDEYTLFGRDDTIIDNESLLNINWGSPGTVPNIPASGYPVLVISVNGRYGDSQKKLVAWAYGTAGGPSIFNCGLCTCDHSRYAGVLTIDSFNSSSAPYDPGDPGVEGSGCSNGSADVTDSVNVKGSVITGSFLDLDGAHIWGDVIAGGPVDNDASIVDGDTLQNEVPVPQPCPCNTYTSGPNDVDTLVATAKANNPPSCVGCPNASIPLNPWSSPGVLSSDLTFNPNPGYDADLPGPYHLMLETSDYLIIPPGDYYFDSVNINSNTKIILGYDDIPPGGDGIVDRGLDGGVVNFYVEGLLEFGDDSEITGFEDELKPTDFTIYSSFHALPDPPYSNEEINLYGTTVFIGTIIAPYSRIEIDSFVDLYGAVLGDYLKANDDVEIHFDDALKDKFSPGGGAYKMFSWNKD